MAKKNPYEPPRFGEQILRFLLPKVSKEQILGDLREDYTFFASRYSERRARIWYWNQVFTKWSYLSLLILKFKVPLKFSRKDSFNGTANFSVAFLKLILPPEKAENILGDLDEIYSERVIEYGISDSMKWYRKQVRASIWKVIFEAIKDKLFSWAGRRVS
jgi:hypothetical protein